MLKDKLLSLLRFSRSSKRIPPQLQMILMLYLSKLRLTLLAKWKTEHKKLPNLMLSLGQLDAHGTDGGSGDTKTAMLLMLPDKD